MTQQTLFHLPARPDPDICRNRHGGNAQSTAADRRVRKQVDRERVLAQILKTGAHGATLDEIADAFNEAPNRLSGRITELKKSGRIIPTGITRMTRTGSPAMVYQVAIRAVGGQGI